MFVLLTRIGDRELIHICHQIIDYFVYEHDLCPMKITDKYWKEEKEVKFFFETIVDKYWCPWVFMSEERLEALRGEDLTKEFFDEYFGELMEWWKDGERY